MDQSSTTPNFATTGLRVRREAMGGDQDTTVDTFLAAWVSDRELKLKDALQQDPWDRDLAEYQAKELNVIRTLIYQNGSIGIEAATCRLLAAQILIDSSVVSNNKDTRILANSYSLHFAKQELLWFSTNDSKSTIGYSRDAEDAENTASSLFGAARVILETVASGVLKAIGTPSENDRGPVNIPVDGWAPTAARNPTTWLSLEQRAAQLQPLVTLRRTYLQCDRDGRDRLRSGRTPEALRALDAFDAIHIAVERTTAVDAHQLEMFAPAQDCRTQSILTAFDGAGADIQSVNGR